MNRIKSIRNITTPLCMLCSLFLYSFEEIDHLVCFLNTKFRGGSSIFFFGWYFLEIQYHIISYHVKYYIYHWNEKKMNEIENRNGKNFFQNEFIFFIFSMIYMWNCVVQFIYINILYVHFFNCFDILAQNICLIFFIYWPQNQYYFFIIAMNFILRSDMHRKHYSILPMQSIYPILLFFLMKK